MYSVSNGIQCQVNLMTLTHGVHAQIQTMLKVKMIALMRLEMRKVSSFRDGQHLWPTKYMLNSVSRKVGKTEVRFLLDTGATISLIRQTLVARLPQEFCVPIHDYAVTQAVTADGTMMPFTRCVQVPVRIKEKQLKPAF